MILARLSEQLRSQNWAAVIIELLVVILGVYIGFQITAWDEEREIASQKGMYLERLREDLLHDASEIDLVVRVNTRAMEDIRYLEAVIGNPIEAASDPNRIMGATGFPGGVRQLRLRRDSYDELVANGKLGVLSNRELEDVIIEFYSDREERDQFNVLGIEKAIQFQELVSGLLGIDQLLAAYPFKNENININIEFPNISLTPEEAINIAESMAARKDLVNTLPGLYMSKLGILREALIYQQRVEELIERIDIEIELFGRD